MSHAIKLEHQKKALGEKSGVRPALRPCFGSFKQGKAVCLQGTSAGSGCQWCILVSFFFSSEYLLSVCTLCGGTVLDKFIPRGI